MFEYAIVFLIVGIAVYFTARKLWCQTKGYGCDGCICQFKGKKIEALGKIKKDNNR